MTEEQKPVGEQESTLVTTSIKFFLESFPPGASAKIEDYAQLEIGGSIFVNTPALNLYCDSVECAGDHYFDIVSDKLNKPYAHTTAATSFFLTYLCRHCQRNSKYFGLVGWRDEGRNLSGVLIKVGELPSFGPPTPNKLLRLFGSDSKTFLKGRQCENQNFGIGAFSYYRRIVEQYKDRLISEMVKAAKRLGATSEAIEALEAAKKEIQFDKAVDSIKVGIPEGLMIGGHNPLQLLHRALSQGLHASTDEECLVLATDIRLVLTALVERISQAVKDEQELDLAVNRLTRPKTAQN